MSRLFAEDDLIDVQADIDGLPLKFKWKGAYHHVEQVTIGWSIDTDWWVKRRWRELFKVITDTGLLVVVYHDLVSDSWYLHRLFD